MLRRRDLLLGFACAAAAAKSRRRDGGPVVDTHAHWYPPEWLKLATSSGAEMPVSATPEAVDITNRLRVMDREGVDVQALSLTLPMVHWAPPALGLKLAQTFNDAASRACQDHPERFVAMATLPVQAPDLAVQEMQRAAMLPGIRGIYLPTNVNGKDLDDHGFFPIYEDCEKRNWPVFLHPVVTIGQERTTRFYLRNLLGNPYDTGVAAASLIFGGVLDAFPKLEILLPHGGGAFPAVLGRLDHGVEVRPELKHMKKPASAYLRRFTFDTITHNSAALTNLIRSVGADRLMLGSDYPFDMGYQHPVDIVERLPGLSATDRDQILGSTAARLLQIHI